MGNMSNILHNATVTLYWSVVQFVNSSRSH